MAKQLVFTKREAALILEVDYNYCEVPQCPFRADEKSNVGACLNHHRELNGVLRDFYGEAMTAIKKLADLSVDLSFLRRDVAGDAFIARCDRFLVVSLKTWSQDEKRLNAIAAAIKKEMKTAQGRRLLRAAERACRGSSKTSHCAVIDCEFQRAAESAKGMHLSQQGQLTGIFTAFYAAAMRALNKLSPLALELSRRGFNEAFMERCNNFLFAAQKTWECDVRRLIRNNEEVFASGSPARRGVGVGTGG
jgi:hypothetical protein